MHMPNYKEPFPLEMHFSDILLEVEKVETESIILAMSDDIVRESDTGIVVAVGPYVGKETTIRPGHRIRFRRLAGEKIKWEGNDYLIITANDVRFTILHSRKTSDIDGSSLRAV